MEIAKQQELIMASEEPVKSDKGQGQAPASTEESLKSDKGQGQMPASTEEPLKSGGQQGQTPVPPKKFLGPAGPSTGKPKKPRRKMGILFWVIFGILFILMLNSFTMPQRIPRIGYSEFLAKLEKGDIFEVTIGQGEVIGEYHSLDDTGKREKFRSFAPEDPELIKLLRQNNVPFKAQPPTRWWSGLITWLPMLIFIAIWIFLIRSMKGPAERAFSFGRSKAKLHTPDQPRTTFNDVAGVDEAKEELKEVIEFLKDPQRFRHLGGRIPRGVLLLGPPGCGKTLLAKAVAGEANVPFYSISGSDFVEMFVGVGASRVRDLFAEAKKNRPCLIFIDEIDAVGRQRFAGIGGGHDEREQTLNQLLTEMDGFVANEEIIIIAATNRPDVLDPALLRPGRFDRHIVVNLPDIKGREQIIKVHARNIKLSAQMDLKILARRTPGFVGADLANMINEAALLAGRKGKKEVEMKEFEEAIDRVIAGPERKSRVISEKEKKIIAYHESGHALSSKMLPGADPVHKVSIIPRGVAALGYTLQLPLEDRYLLTKNEILDRITVLLAGRVSEELFFNEITTGAQNDLEKATEVVHKMICEYGMSEKLGPITFHKKEEMIFLGRDITQQKEYSEEIAALIDAEVRRIIDECYQRAVELINKHKEKLERLAQVLMKKEILEQEEINSLLEEKNG